MKEILLILGVASFAAILNTLPLYEKVLRKIKMYRKPFSCAKCLSFWVYIILGIFLNTPILYLVLGAFISAVAGELLLKKLMTY